MAPGGQAKASWWLVVSPTWREEGEERGRGEEGGRREEGEMERREEGERREMERRDHLSRRNLCMEWDYTCYGDQELS